MFLGRKKQTTFTLKTRNQQTEKKQEKPIVKKALGGWGDDQQQQQKSYPPIINTQSNNLLQSEKPSQPIIQVQKQNNLQLYNYDQLSEKTNLQYETKLVNDIIQPGGIRIKPNQALLAEFCKAAKTLEAPIIASLLISRLQLQIPFVMKAKALYTIQYLSNKIQVYRSYFLHYMNYIKELPYPNDSKQQYQNLLQQISNSLIGIQKQSKQNNEKLLEFNDPGYNVPPPKPIVQQSPLNFINKVQKKQKDGKITKKLISPEQMKKMKNQQNQQTNSTQAVNQTTVNQIPKQLNILDINSPPKSTQDQKKKIDIFDVDFSNFTLDPKSTNQTEIKNINQNQNNNQNNNSKINNLDPFLSLYSNQPQPTNNNQVPIISNITPTQQLGGNNNYNNFTQIPNINQNNGYNNAAYLQQQYLLYNQYQMNLAMNARNNQQLDFNQQQFNPNIYNKK